MSDNTCVVYDICCVAKAVLPVKSIDSSSAEGRYHLKMNRRLDINLTDMEKIYSSLVSSNIEIVIKKSTFFESQLC